MKFTVHHMEYDGWSKSSDNKKTCTPIASLFRAVDFISVPQNNNLAGFKSLIIRKLKDFRGFQIAISLKYMAV